MSIDPRSADEVELIRQLFRVIEARPRKPEDVLNALATVLGLTILPVVDSDRRGAAVECLTRYVLKTIEQFEQAGPECQPTVQVLQ